MKKSLFMCCCILWVLAGCASTQYGSNEMYGEIQVGVEHSRCF